MALEHRRLVIGLIKKASDDLDELTEWLGVTEADAINQAIQVYRFVRNQIAEGNRLAILDVDKMEFETVSLKIGPQEDE